MAFVATRWGIIGSPKRLSDGTWTHFVSWHLPTHPKGIYLLTSFENGHEAVSYYRLRFKPGRPLGLWAGNIVGLQ